MIRFAGRILFSEAEAYKAINDHNKNAETKQKQYEKSVASIEKNNWTRETKDAHIAKLAKPSVVVPIECLTVLWQRDKPLAFDGAGHSLWVARLRDKSVQASYNSDIWSEAIVQELAESFYDMESET